LGLIFTLLKGKWLNLMGSNFFDLDLLTIITAYLFLSYGRTAAGTFAFGQGFLIDLFSGGLQGLFSMLCIGVFGAIYLGCRFFDLQTPKGQVILVSLAVLFKKILFLFVLVLFSPKVTFPGTFLWISVASAIITGLMATIIFYLFNSLRAISFEDPRSALTK
jgi:rod shape-determining protein MreD